MATLGTVGNLLGAALKGSVNASIDQYRERRAEAQGKVDWEEYNYPPWINVLHYNVDDVEDAPARLAVKIAHVNYVCVASTFLVNLLGVIILAGGGAVDGVNVVYSLNAVITPSSACTPTTVQGPATRTGARRITTSGSRRVSPSVAALRQLQRRANGRARGGRGARRLLGGVERFECLHGQLPRRGSRCTR